MSFPGRGDHRPPNGFVCPMRASTSRPVPPRSSATSAMALPPVFFWPSAIGVRLSSPPSCPQPLVSLPDASPVAYLPKEEARKKLLVPQTALAPAAAIASEAEGASDVDMVPLSAPSTASSSAPAWHQLSVPAAPVFFEPPSAAGLDVQKTPFVSETVLVPPGAAKAAALDLAPICNKLLARSVRLGLGTVKNKNVAYLILRGMKTLHLHVQCQNNTAMRMAQFLEEHPKIARVYYPGLPSHPEHHIAKSQMTGFGGVVSFEVAGDFDATRKFIDSVKIPYHVPSFGGCESIID